MHSRQQQVPMATGIPRWQIIHYNPLQCLKCATWNSVDKGNKGHSEQMVYELMIQIFSKYTLFRCETVLDQVTVLHIREP